MKRRAGPVLLRTAQQTHQMLAGQYVCQVVVPDLLADQKHRVATQWSI